MIIRIDRERFEKARKHYVKKLGLWYIGIYRTRYGAVDCYSDGSVVLFRCPICGFLFISPEDIEAHLRKYHGIG